MGDAGKYADWLYGNLDLLETTQGKTHPISPVTALWIIAIPLMDMVAIMYRRLRKGMSPFSAGSPAYSSFSDARRVYFPTGICS